MFTSEYSATDIFLGDRTCSPNTSALQEVLLKQMGNQMPWGTMSSLWSQIQGWKER